MLYRVVVSSWKYRLKKRFPLGVWLYFARIAQQRKSNTFREYVHVNSKNLYPETILVIRRRPPGGGLFSNVNHVLQGLELSRERESLPVVDMENYWTSYSQRNPVDGTKNAWEYFFEPVSRIRLPELKHYSSVTYSAGDRINPNSILAVKNLGFIQDKEKIEYIHNLYRAHVKLNTLTSKFLENVKEFLDWNSNTIGVFYRGTDYVELEPKGHARQPALNLVTKSLLNKLEDSRMSKVLISTEDHQARRILSNIAPECIYPDFRDSALMNRLSPFNSKLSPQALKALGYLAETYLLSESYTAVSSIANGSAMAFIINGNRFNQPVVFNLGSY